jgi:hypothetical protein
MVEAANDRGPSRLALLKVIYLLAVTAAAFGLPAFETTQWLSWYVVPAMLAAQILTLLVCGLGGSEVFRVAWRLKWLFLFLLVCYTLLRRRRWLGCRQASDLPASRYALDDRSQSERAGPCRVDVPAIADGHSGFGCCAQYWIGNRSGGRITSPAAPAALCLYPRSDARLAQHATRRRSQGEAPRAKSNTGNQLILARHCSHPAAHCAG